MIIHFEVAGNPKPKERPRFGKHAVYTSKKTSEWEKLVKQSANEFMISRNASVLKEMNLAVVLLFRRQTRQRVDIDNLAKSVLDGMNKIVYEDDTMIKATVISLDFDKQNPGVDIWVFDQNDFMKDFISNLMDSIKKREEESHD